MTKPIKIKEHIQIQELIGDDTPIMFYDEFAKAIIGTAQRINLGPVVAYDVEKCIEILSRDMEVEESDLEEGETIESKKYEMAYEHFNYNVIGGYLGDETPVFIRKT